MYSNKQKLGKTLSGRNNKKLKILMKVVKKFEKTLKKKYFFWEKNIFFSRLLHDGSKYPRPWKDFTSVT